MSGFTTMDEQGLTERSNAVAQTLAQYQRDNSINRTPKSNISMPGKIFENSQTRGNSKLRDQQLEIVEEST